MSENFENGVFAREPAWHRQGIVLEDQDYFSPSQGLELCPQFASELQGVNVQTVDGVPVPDVYAVVRQFDNKVVGVGKEQLIQGLCDGPRLMQVIETIFGDDSPKLESIGTLKDGRLLWALAQMGDINVMGKDLIKSYLMVSTGLDGSLSTVLGDTDVRVVCSNTHAMAMRDVSQKVKHTRNHESKLQGVELALAEAYQRKKERAELYEAMAATKLSDAEADVFFKQALQAKEKDGQLSTRTKNNLDRIWSAYESGDDYSQDFLGTVWGGYNAVTNYANHGVVVKGEFLDKEKTKEAPDAAAKRMDSVFFGAAGNISDRALNLATLMVSQA